MNAQIACLQDKIRQIEQGRAVRHLTEGPGVGETARCATGWSAIDETLAGGLAPGLHEWLGLAPAPAATNDPDQKRYRRPSRWTPPLCLLAHLVFQVLQSRAFADHAVWIGRLCHPYGRTLVRPRDEARPLLSQSLFVAVRDTQLRVWSADLALRSPAIGMVTADGSGWSMSDTQRIHLLAQQESKFALLARPPREQKRLSAAQTRWLVRCHPDVPDRAKPRWSVQLLRCKGVRPVGDHRAWLLEWNRGTGIVDLSAPLADPAAAKESDAQRAHRLAARSA